MLLFVVLCCVYVCSGAFYSVVYASAVNHGVAKPESLLGLLPRYFGMVIAGELMKVVLSDAQNESEKLAETKYIRAISKRFWLIACLHFFASTLILYAITVAGPSLFQVCYSSSPIFATLLQYGILGEKISLFQAGAIFIIVFGLATLVLLQPEHETDLNPGSNWDNELVYAYDPDVLEGAFLTFATVFSYSLCNTLCKVILHHGKDKARGGVIVHPSSYLRELGIRCLKLNLLFVLLWTVPLWNFLVVEPLETAAPSLFVVFLYYTGLLICNTGMNFSFYWIISKSSVVLLSILGGITTVSSLLLSHYFMCDTSRSYQCMTYHKGKCSAFVIGGVALYGFASTLKTKKQK